MKPSRFLLAATLVIGTALRGGEPATAPADTPAPAPAGAAAASETKADKRFEEMLDRMQAAVQEVAELYGNPVVLQVFTNDASRAADLKQRLSAARSGSEIRAELASLQKRREELLADIALKQREATRLASKLSRQRAALDALGSAVEQAQRAVEDTAK